MEIETTPWHETRTLIAPCIEMLQKDGIIQYKGSFLKKESPRHATLKKRYIQYGTSYLKYCFLKEFYQFLFDGVKEEAFKGDENELATLLAETVTDFIEYCREQPTEENGIKLFRAFCKAHLYGTAAKAQ